MNHTVPTARPHEVKKYVIRNKNRTTQIELVNGANLVNQIGGESIGQHLENLLDVAATGLDRFAALLTRWRLGRESHAGVFDARDEKVGH